MTDQELRLLELEGGVITEATIDVAADGEPLAVVMIDLGGGRTAMATCRIVEEP